MSSIASTKPPSSTESVKRRHMRHRYSPSSLVSDKSKRSSVSKVSSRDQRSGSKSNSRKFKNSLPSWINESAADPAKVIGLRLPSQPNIFYDLLPPRLKHPSYILRADLCVSRTRFILQHRVIYRHYSELNAKDSFGLVHLALMVAKVFDLANASLTVPLGTANVFLDDKETFYSYISMPSVTNFLRAFHLLKFELPNWPDNRWRTPLWPCCHGETNMERVFEKSLSKYRESYHDSEVLLVSKSSHKPRVEGARYSEKLASATGPSFGLFKHSYLPNLLAVATPRGSVDHSCQSRWKLLESVHQRLSRWCNLCEVKCHLSMSLAEPYQFRTIRGCDTFILLQFPEDVPESLKSRIRLTGSQRDRQSRKPNASLMNDERSSNPDPVDEPAILRSSPSGWKTLISKIDELTKMENGEEKEGRQDNATKTSLSVAARWQNFKSNFNSGRNSSSRTVTVS